MAHGEDKTHIPVSVQVCEELNTDSITLMKGLLTQSDRNKGKCIKGIQGRRDVGGGSKCVRQEKKKPKDEVTQNRHTMEG